MFYLYERLHDIDGDWNDLGRSQLNLDEVFDQLILLHRERHDRLMNWDEIAAEIGIVDHLKIGSCAPDCHGAVSLKRKKFFLNNFFGVSFIWLLQYIIVTRT